MNEWQVCPKSMRQKQCLQFMCPTYLPTPHTSICDSHGRRGRLWRVAIGKGKLFLNSCLEKLLQYVAITRASGIQRPFFFIYFDFHPCKKFWSLLDNKLGFVIVLSVTQLGHDSRYFISTEWECVPAYKTSAQFKSEINNDRLNWCSFLFLQRGFFPSQTALLGGLQFI